MKKKTLFFFGPYTEFTSFIKMNRIIWREKQKKEYDEIIAIVPFQAVACVSEADRVLSISHQFHVKTNTNYPALLNRKPDLTGKYGDTWRDRQGYLASGFMQEALWFIEKNFENYDIAMWHGAPSPQDPAFTKVLPDNFKWIMCMDYIPNPAGGSNASRFEGWCHIQFNDVWDCLNAGMIRLKPFQEDFDAIKENYGHLFDEKTYVVHSRNFPNKQYGVHTSNFGVKARFKEAFNSLMDKGYKFINVGFPPADFGLNHKNYTEFQIHDFSYSEYLSFCRLAAGWLMFADAGGWHMHVCTDLEILAIDYHHSSLSNTWRPSGKSIADLRGDEVSTATVDINSLPEPDPAVATTAEMEIFKFMKDINEPERSIFVMSNMVLNHMVLNHKPACYNNELISFDDRVILIDKVGWKECQ